MGAPDARVPFRRQPGEKAGQFRRGLGAFPAGQPAFGQFGPQLADAVVGGEHGFLPSCEDGSRPPRCRGGPGQGPPRAAGPAGGWGSRHAPHGGGAAHP